MFMFFILIGSLYVFFKDYFVVFFFDNIVFVLLGNVFIADFSRIMRDFIYGLFRYINLNLLRHLFRNSNFSF